MKRQDQAESRERRSGAGRREWGTTLNGTRFLLGDENVGTRQT